MKWLLLLLAMALLTLQYRLWFGDGSLSEVVQLSSELKRQKQRLRELEERNRKLEARVLDLQQGFDAYEEQARQDLGMVRKGETFFQIIDAPATGRAGQ